jgi:YbbR domain-containing protein
MKKSDNELSPVAQVFCFIIAVVLVICLYCCVNSSEKNSSRSSSSSETPHLDHLRTINDPDKADQYAKDNLNSLLREAWPKGKK